MPHRAATTAAAVLVLALQAVVPFAATSADGSSHRPEAYCTEKSCADSELEVLVQVRRSGARPVPDALTEARATSEESCEDGLCSLETETETEDLVQIRRSGSRPVPDSTAVKQLPLAPVAETSRAEGKTKLESHGSLLLHQMSRGQHEAVVDGDGQVDAADAAEEDPDLSFSPLTRLLVDGKDAATADATTKAVDKALAETYVNVSMQDANKSVPTVAESENLVQVRRSGSRPVLESMAAKQLPMAPVAVAGTAAQEPNSAIGLPIKNSETSGVPVSLLQTEQTSEPQWEPRSSGTSAAASVGSVVCILAVAVVALGLAFSTVVGKKDLFSGRRPKQPEEKEASLEMKLTEAMDRAVSDAEPPFEAPPKLCPARLPEATASFIIPLGSFTAAQQDVGYFDVHSNLMMLRACFLAPNRSPTWSAMELYTLDSPWNSEALLMSLQRDDSDGQFRIRARGREIASIQSSANSPGQWLLHRVASDRAEEGPLQVRAFLGGKLMVAYDNDGSCPLLATASRDGDEELLQLDVRLSTKKGLQEEAAMLVLSVLAVLACSEQSQPPSWLAPAAFTDAFLSLTAIQPGAPRLGAIGKVTSFIVPERRLTDQPDGREQVSYEVIAGPGFAALTATLWCSKDDDAWAVLELAAEDQLLLSCCRPLVDSTLGTSRQAKRHPASQGLLIQGPRGELLGTMTSESHGQCMLRRPGYSSFNIQAWPDSRLVTGTDVADGGSLLALAAATEAAPGQGLLQLDVGTAGDSAQAPMLLIAVLGALAFQPWRAPSAAATEAGDRGSPGARCPLTMPATPAAS